MHSRKEGERVSPEYEKIISNIKCLIKRKGMKQCVVAERAGFTAQELSDILSGRRKLLRVEHILPVADALGVEVKELFYLSDQKGGREFGKK